jgi:hypothetical protein
MFETDDAKRLRWRGSALADDLGRQDPEPPIGAPTLLARTTTLSAYPSTAQCFFACQPLTLLGAEVEGGAGTISQGNSTFFALNLGTTVPPAGTQVVTTFVGNRWVFRYDS